MASELERLIKEQIRATQQKQTVVKAQLKLNLTGQEYSILSQITERLKAKPNEMLNILIKGSIQNLLDDHASVYPNAEEVKNEILKIATQFAEQEREKQKEEAGRDQVGLEDADTTGDIENFIKNRTRIMLDRRPVLNLTAREYSILLQITERLEVDPNKILNMLFKKGIQLLLEEYIAIHPNPQAIKTQILKNADNFAQDESQGAQGKKMSETGGPTSSRPSNTTEKKLTGWRL